MRKILAILVLFFSTQVFAEAPIEAYGELPEVRAFDYSPDGTRFAFFRRQGSQDLMAVFEEGKGNIATVDVTDVMPRSINFISNNHILVYASDYSKKWGGIRQTKVFNYDIAKEKIEPLKDRSGNFRQRSAAIGNDLTPTGNPDEVFYSSSRYGSEDLLRVNLSTGKADRHARGKPSTFDWVVTPDGVILAREDYNSGDRYSVSTFRNNEWELVYEETFESRQERKSVFAYTPDRTGLYVWANNESSQFDTIHKLSFDGTLSEPLFDTDKREYLSAITSAAGELIGIRYAGLKPSYKFFDPELDQIMKAFASQFPEDDVTLVDWTDDYSRLVMLIDGGKTAPAYYLFDRDIPEFSLLSPRYLRITNEDIMPVKAMQYKASDGMTIPAILTHPKGASASSKLPLIVIPHGGPESHDQVEFDYRAQYFASRGYLVLQPNFRGSSGFGKSHRDAGFGEYGGKMQTDIIDGTKHLINTGWADPNRVCIIGASYGGYSALMNGALAPDLYKCVIAIAPVTDEVEYLRLRRVAWGNRSSAIEYWEIYYGVDRNDVDGLYNISPVSRAADFKAPILLIHGKHDLVVDIDQSDRMEKALINAGKKFTYLKLDSGDHSLSSSETRLEALQAADRFVRETIGPGN